jgi:hypothetical protein
MLQKLQKTVTSDEQRIADWRSTIFDCAPIINRQSKIGNPVCRVRTLSPADELSMAQSQEEMAVYFVFYVLNV